MISKQEWFEKYGIIHDIENHIQNRVARPTTTALWQKWKEMRMMCIDLAIDDLPPKQKKVMKYIFFEKLPRDKIAKKLKTTKNNIAALKKRASDNLKKNILVKFFIQAKEIKGN